MIKKGSSEEFITTEALCKILLKRLKKRITTKEEFEKELKEIKRRIGGKIIENTSQEVVVSNIAKEQFENKSQLFHASVIYELTRSIFTIEAKKIAPIFDTTAIHPKAAVNFTLSD